MGDSAARGLMGSIKSSSRKVFPPGPTDLASLTDKNGEEISQFEMLGRLHEEYGDVFQYNTLAGTLYVFNHPDYIKTIFKRLNITRTPLLSLALGEGLLAADNDHWKRQRRLMLPVFARPKVAKFTSLIAEIATEHLKRWDIYAKSAKPVDIVNIMSRLTLSVVSKVMFSVDMGKETKDFLNAYTVAIKHLGDLVNATSFNMPMLISPTTNAQFQHALEQMDTVVYSIIKERQNSKTKPDDLLTLLLNAVDADTEKPLTEVQIRDEVVTMLLAGHETTSLSMTWVWYLLGLHPEIRDRLGREVDAVLGSRMVNYEDTRTLKYLRMVVEETMRLYPPVAAIWRQPRFEVEIGGYTIPEGTGIIVSPFLMHRHSDFWDDPLLFNPDRFDPATSPKCQAFVYFPFGGGRHTCIGKHFAMLESQVILATAMQHYRLRLLDSQSVVPLYSITLRPKEGLRCVVERYSPNGHHESRD